MKILKSTTLLGTFFAILLCSPAVVFADSFVRTEKFDNGQISNEYTYEGSLSQHKYFNNRGRLSGWRKFTYPQKDQVIVTAYSVDAANLGQIISQDEWRNLGPLNKVVPESIRVRSWILSKEKNKLFDRIDYFNPEVNDQVSYRTYLDDKQKVSSTLKFYYGPALKTPIGFVEQDSRGKVLADYFINEKYSLRNTLAKSGKSSAEIKSIETLRNNPDKFLVAIIDSGFDYNHESLVSKWWNNPQDPIDGIDNDGNGWIDDNFGWNQFDKIGLPSEVTSALNKDQRPLSHGTHVANLASAGLEQIGLIGFSGDYTQASYIQEISTFLKTHKVKVVNMSLGLPNDFKNEMGLKDSIKAYDKMFNENPDTLFVVAAGNSALNIDEWKNRQYPANSTQDNVLKVGSLETSSIDSMTPLTPMSAFSNYGVANVDILVPGRNILAASLGGGEIKHSGTSMSTPIMVNQIVQLWSQLPNLSAREVKELFIRTATVLTPPAPVKSGGYVNLKRALLEGKLTFLKDQQSAKAGPNCWNAASYLSGSTAGLSHSSDFEIAALLASPLCTEVREENAQAGDIIALRRFTKSGKLLPAPFLSEVHAHTYIDSLQSFTKNGVLKTNPYEYSTPADVFNFYKKSEPKNCKISDIDKDHCNLKQVIYRCTSPEQYFKKSLTWQEKEVLRNLRSLEKATENDLFLGKKSNLDRSKAQSQLHIAVKALVSSGSSPVLTTYIVERINSLSMTFGNQ